MPTPDLQHLQVRDDVAAHLAAGTSVALVGLPGSGRSTLVRAVAAALGDDGWRVVRLHGIRALRDRPLEAFAVAGLVPRPDARGGSAVSGAAGRLRAALGEGRAALLIDDVDLLDEASCGVVASVHAQDPFPVLASSRPRPRAQVVPGSDLHPATRVTIPPLGFDDFQDLLTDVLPDGVAAALAGRLFTLSGGLPRLATTLVEVARQHGAIELADGVWQAATELFSPEAAPEIEPFLDDLGAGARAARETVAVVGTLSVQDARRLTSTDALAELESAGLLRLGPRGDDVVVGVYPHAVAEYLRREVPRVRRIELDEHLRDLGIDAPTDGARLPSSTLHPHGTEPDEAGTVLTRMFVEEWAHLTLRRHAEWERSPSPQTGLPYLQALLAGGSEPSVLRYVAEHTPPGELPVWRARWKLWHGTILAEVEHDLPAAVRILTDAAADAREYGPWLESDARRLQILHGVVPTEPQEPPGTTAPAVVRQAVQRVEGQRRLALGDAARALSLLETADAAQDASDADLGVWTEVVHNLSLVAAGRGVEAIRRSRAGLERGRVDLDPDAVHGHGYVVSLALLLLARSTELRAHLGATLSIGLRASLHRQFEAGNRAVGAMLAALEGRTDAARALAQQATAVEGALGPYPITTPTMALALLDAREHGDSPDARQRVADRLWAEAEALHARGIVLSTAFSGAFSVGFTPDAARYERLQDMVGDASSLVVQDLVRLADAAMAPPEEAAAIGRDLVEHGQVLLGARAFSYAAGRFERAGAADAGRTALADARTLVRRHGGDPSEIVRPVQRAAALTPREQQIASLVVAGRTNDEISQQLHLSLRTVQNNLGRAFAKLGVSGRGELTRELLEG